MGSKVAKFEPLVNKIGVVEFDQFKIHVSPAAKNSCWEWKGPQNVKGDPMFHVKSSEGNQESVSARRLMFRFMRQPKLFPTNLVWRCCNTRLCVNPEHASLECPESKRRAVGQAIAQSKLTEAEVKSIRSAVYYGCSHGEIAARYGISPTSVFNIVHKKTWAHVT